MRIDYMSDLHGNHHVPFDTNQLKWQSRTEDWMTQLVEDNDSDVLVLAGDFSEWNQQTYWMIETASRFYDKVFITVGNHDYYLLSKSQRKKYKTSFGRIVELRCLLADLPNVTLLYQSVESYKGVTFAGDPLWYALMTEADRHFYHRHSNDSVYIHTGNPYEEPYDVLHNQSMAWYNTLDEQAIDVFVSHVPPVHSPLSTHKQSGCYMTPVPFLKGRHWICGHQHVQGSFKKAGTTFHMNPLGYPSERLEKKLKTFSL